MEEEMSREEVEAKNKSKAKMAKNEKLKQKQKAQKDICVLCGERVSGQKEMWLMCRLCGGWCHLEFTDCSGASTSGGYVCDWRRA